MVMEPHAGAWGALLGACKIHGDLELGEVISKRLFELEPTNAGNYVVYAVPDRWADVSKAKATMREKGIRKLPGYPE